MNCPTRDNNPLGMDGYNQNPPYLAPELTTRASLVCGGKTDGTYNLPLHVLALFIVLVQSILWKRENKINAHIRSLQTACSIPLMVKKFPQLRVPHHFLDYSPSPPLQRPLPPSFHITSNLGLLIHHCSFGTGVLIATAFVHLLPTAFTSLTDPCLPAFWNTSYPAMAGLIAMASVFLVVTIEMVFSTMNGGAMSCHSIPGGAYDPLTPNATNFGHRRGNSSASMVSFGGRGERNTVLGKTRHRRSGSIGNQLQKIERDSGMGRDSLDLELEISAAGSSDSAERERRKVADEESSESEDDYGPEAETRNLNGRPSVGNRTRSMNSEGRMRSELAHRNGSGRLTEQQQQQKNLLQVLLLEAGILFHSVFIGMALSVATGSNFIVLLIAIVFHQTFEGLALGSRIASITAFPKDSPKPWLMCLAYGTTTPIGQAIGLATRKLYDPASQVGLLMVGVMNAISSGLLLFAGLVELLAEDFLSDESYVVLVGWRRWQACLAVAAGAAGMALVGAWA
ncbi:hypothetical protein RUND412_007428 [Rhizina undulata]